jgi:5-methylcytosine-specific restriction endonuclease McrA
MQVCLPWHLGDHEVLRAIPTLVTGERTATTFLIAHLAIAEARKLYVMAGRSSMHAYCVEVVGLADDAAYRRIYAARAVLEFPAILEALMDGRLSLTSILLLRPHLNRENVAGLIEAVAGKTKPQIEQVLASRFPRSELLPLVEAHPARPTQLAPEQVTASPRTELAPEQVVPGPRAELAPEQAAPEPPAARTQVAPIAVGRYGVHFSMRQSTYDKFCRIQELLGHEFTPGQMDEVVDRAFSLALAVLEKRKFAATSRPRRTPPSTESRRHIPAHVKRAVWERDGGRCTFTNETGQRCTARALLELDHVVPVARGGRATVEGIRLRCRAHNHYEAERVFGAGFMEHKREEARTAAPERATAAERARAAAEARAGKSAEAESARLANQRAEEIIPYLRKLGLRADEARRAAAACETAPDAPLEKRVRAALAAFGRDRGRCRSGAAGAPGARPGTA